MFILDYVEDKEASEFYPTPESLVNKMIEDIDFGMIETILEPSAGKGDILKVIARKINDEYSRWVSRRRCDVDAIEIDPNLRAILKHNFSDEYRRELEDKIDVIKGKYGRPALITKYAYVDKETGERIDLKIWAENVDRATAKAIGVMGGPNAQYIWTGTGPMYKNNEVITRIVDKE